MSCLLKCGRSLSRCRKKNARILRLDDAEFHFGGSEKARRVFFKSPAPCAGARSRAAGGHFQRPNPCQQAGSPLLLRQARSRAAGIPSSPAIWLNGRPLPPKSPKASRLNSSVYRRRTAPIKHLPAPKGAYQRCPPFRRRVSYSLRHVRGHLPCFHQARFHLAFAAHLWRDTGRVGEEDGQPAPARGWRPRDGPRAPPG